MRKHIGYFTLGGLQWNCFIDNSKSHSAEKLYISDNFQLELNIASVINGIDASKDKTIEYILRGIINLVLYFMGEKDLRKEEYIIPFSNLLYQFIKTDDFNGKNGSFFLGGTRWEVVNDRTHTFHRDVLGECDSNIGRIILELIDHENGTPITIEFVRHNYIHEVIHAILNSMGLIKHEENFVQVKGVLLYEALNTLTVIEDNKEVRMWPPKEYKPEPVTVKVNRLKRK